MKKLKRRSTTGHARDNDLVRNIYGPYDRFPVGEVGIEIEVEGSNFPNLNYYWRRDHDGSLRGDSAEYVLKSPVKRKTVRKALMYLKKNLSKGSVVSETNRTGVHVHINMLRQTNVQVFNMIVLYIIFEDLLVEWCGQDRVGNHFCLRVKDAKNLLRILRRCAEQGSLASGFSDRVRYAALNINAMPRYGSLEFRALRGTVNPVTIETWVRLLLKIKDYSSKFETPFAILEEFSKQGVEQFTDDVFGKDTKELINVEEPWIRIEESMYLAQDIAGAFTVGRQHWRDNKDQKDAKTHHEAFFDEIVDAGPFLREQDAGRVETTHLANGVYVKTEGLNNIIRYYPFTNSATPPIITTYLRSEGAFNLRRRAIPEVADRSVDYYVRYSPSNVSRFEASRRLGYRDGQIPDEIWYNFVKEDLKTVYPEREIESHQPPYSPTAAYEREEFLRARGERRMYRDAELYRRSIADDEQLMQILDDF